MSQDEIYELKRAAVNAMVDYANDERVYQLARSLERTLEALEAAYETPFPPSVMAVAP